MQNDKTKERSKVGYKLQGMQRSDKKLDTLARIKNDTGDKLDINLDSENTTGLYKVAITGRAINARQYSAVRKRKSMGCVACLVELSCVCVLSAFSCVCVISAMDDGNCSPG